MPVSPLSNTGKLTQKDLDGYLKSLGSEPKNVAQAEIQRLLEAGEARLPEGAGSKLQDALWALQNDRWDPTQQGTEKRTAPAGITTMTLERNASQSYLTLNLQGKADPGARVEIFNLSRQGLSGGPIANATVAADGTFAINAQNQNVWFGEQLGVRVVGQSAARSDLALGFPKSYEVTTDATGKVQKNELKQAERTQPPYVQAAGLSQTQQLATAKDPLQHMVLTGKAWTVPPNAKLEVVIDNQAQSINAMPDGSFLFDIKGVKPGTQMELRVIEQGQVSVHRFNAKALTFNADALANAHQGVPYDRMGKEGKADPNGPFLRFDAVVADPGSTVTIHNFTTGKSTEVTADQAGRVNVELAGVHSGDALGFTLRDAAGNVAQQQVEGWVVPNSPNQDAKLSQLLCANNLLKENVDEVIALLQKAPTSVHREALEQFLDKRAGSVVRDGADVVRLQRSLSALFGGENDVRTNASNPQPKEPIVIGARIIKPRVMDQGTVRRDPLEVEGKAEPFSQVEIRNASVQGAPVIGTVTADKYGNFKFVSTDETKFLHGDQLYVKATDGGGASSTSALARTCAYELQIWTQTRRENLVELPHTTDTRQPFLDMSKVKAERQPIAKNGAAQVFTFTGGPGSVEPNAVLRVTTKDGTTSEIKSNKDGSFKLEVGKFVPGETLNLMVVDGNGQVAQQRQNTAPLKLDHAALVASSQGVPYEKLDAAGKPDACGPYLDFHAERVVDPNSIVVVVNNSTGKTVEVQADDTGSLGFSLSAVHTGDSLSIFAKDPAGNLAPAQLENWVVPAAASLTEAMQALECQHQFLAADVDKLLAILGTAPTAANRSVFESILARPGAFDDDKLKNKLASAVAAAYAAPNNVRNNAENPAPKRPIVLDADIIKPRFMDGAPQRGRDPLEVRGKAEPYTWIEIRNASQQGYPQLTRVQADKNGDWKVSFTDETKFLHGDQLLVRAVDQGGASSENRLVTTCAYELQIWHNPPRTEKIKLDKTTDTRQPFLDTSKLTHGRDAIGKDGKTQTYTLTGAAMSAEPGAVIRVTNKKGEAYEGRVGIDGTFKVPVGNHEPGESLAVTVIDGNGNIFNHKVNTPALRFNPQTFLETSDGAPFVRADKGGATSPGQSAPGQAARAQEAAQRGAASTKAGPFLHFTQDAAVDPFSWVFVKNNSTGESFSTQADASGRVDLEISNVHTGDSLSFSCADNAQNKAPQALVNWVVPGEPRALPRLQDLTCQQTLLKDHADEVIALLQKHPTAANRGLVEAWLAGTHTTFQPATDRARIAKAMEGIFVGVHDVRTDTTNPAPKEPIVLDARIIKPRVMDQGSVQNRDPLEVFGTAEPFTWIEVRNASVPGAPSLGRVQADEKGEWKLTNRNESQFLHGDQLLIRAVDQGNVASKETLAKTCQYELQIWNQTQRQELVRLPETTDARAPFIDTSKTKAAQTIAARKGEQTFTVYQGGPLAAEPRSVIRVEGKNGVLSEIKVNDDGSFKLEIANYQPGETLKATCFNAGGQVVTQNIPTAALKFNADQLLQNVDGPPFQKLNKGKPEEGGPFLGISAEQVAFPGARLEVTNHSTGKVEVFVADDKGGFDFELRGVHAFDLLTFKVSDAAGNESPTVQRAWQVPAESRAQADTTIVALTGQRPVSEDVVDLLIQGLQKAPTSQHRLLVDTLLHEHADWFTGGFDKLQAAVKEIYKGPPEIVPDATNPAPKRPIVLGAEIIKPRVMDSGNPPRDPLTVNGIGEPMAWVEIYNGSVPGRPKIGEVQIGEDGKFNFQSNDESKFLHGDQIVVMARDAGGAKSDAVVSKAKAFELRIWNQTNRREKVALTGAAADTRDPFVQVGMVKTERASGSTQQQQSDAFVLVGAAGSTEVFGTVSVIIGANTYKVEADLDGGFRLPVDGLVPGTPIEIIAGDPNGRTTKVRYTPTV